MDPFAVPSTVPASLTASVPASSVVPTPLSSTRSTSRLGSKLIKSRDTIDTNVSLFTTQKKRILDYAIENEVPSKFVFPVYESKLESEREHNRADLSEDVETIEEFISRESKKYDIVDLVEKIREKNPRIKESEALYYISNIVKNDDDFFKKASRISSTYDDPERFENERYNWQKDEIPKLLERDRIDSQRLETYFQNIQSIDPVQTSDMTITKLTIEFDVVLENNDILLNVAPD